jgi:hypothetical protein
LSRAGRPRTDRRPRKTGGPRLCVTTCPQV